jgi:MerR family transcriptional regulator/heat shock protein HspR
MSTDERGRGIEGDGRERGRPEEGRERRSDQARERGVYIISVAAELVGVHPQTLRIYERKGLLSPSRTSGNTRRYSERDIAMLQDIQRLTQEGINLAGVKMIVEMQTELERMREWMAQMRREMDRAAERLRQEVERVRSQHRADIVPFAEIRRLRDLAFGAAASGGGATEGSRAPGSRAPGSGAGPGSGGPGSGGPARRGPIAAGPGG